jgi:ribokinase
MRGGKVVVLGSAVLDRTVRVPALPYPGETARALSVALSLGGKGANQAAAARRLGASVVFVGRVGDDAAGRDTRADLESLGIELELATSAEAATGEAVVLVDDEGENQIALLPGANALLGARDADAAARHLAHAAAFVGQLEVPLEATRRAAEIAAEAGARTILNAAPAHEDTAALLPLFDVAVLNRMEAEQVTGIGVTTLDDALAALRALKDLGSAEPIVTLGKAGAVYVDRGRGTHVKAPVVEAVDATGAGDAFVGALAALLVEGREVPEAIRGACRYAALTVTRPGTRASYPDRRAFDASASA